MQPDVNRIYLDAFERCIRVPHLLHLLVSERDPQSPRAPSAFLKTTLRLHMRCCVPSRPFDEHLTGTRAVGRGVLQWQIIMPAVSEASPEVWLLLQRPTPS